MPKAMLPSKQDLQDELLKQLQADLASVERAHKAAREGATHEEAKPENDKDTRALEQSYVARGQAKRVEELADSAAAVQSMGIRAFRPSDPIALGALVTVDDNGSERIFFMAPEGGGAALAAGRVHVITPRSPVGKALLGKRVGDDCTLQTAGKAREIEVVGIE